MNDFTGTKDGCQGVVDLSICLSVQPMEYTVGLNGPRRMNPTGFGDPLAFTSYTTLLITFMPCRGCELLKQNMIADCEVHPTDFGDLRDLSWSTACGQNCHCCFPQTRGVLLDTFSLICKLYHLY